MQSAFLDAEYIEQHGLLHPETDSSDCFQFNEHREQQLHDEQQQQALGYSEQQSPLEDETVIRGREPQASNIKL